MAANNNESDTGPKYFEHSGLADGRKSSLFLILLFALFFTGQKPVFFDPGYSPG